MAGEILTMTRGDLAQNYPIQKATWGFAKPTPYSVPVLCLALKTAEQDSIFPEDGNCAHQPTWSIDIWMRGLNDNLLLPGSQFSIDDCYDDFTGIIYTMFHYDEFEGTTLNKIKIRNIEGDFLDLSLEGFIDDPQGSMRPTRMSVEARFKKLSPHPEISAQFNRQGLPPHEPPYKATYTPPHST